jgi:hypothetical protein
LLYKDKVLGRPPSFSKAGKQRGESKGDGSIFDISSESLNRVKNLLYIFYISRER